MYLRSYPNTIWVSLLHCLAAQLTKRNSSRLKKRKTISGELWVMAWCGCRPTSISQSDTSSDRRTQKHIFQTGTPCHSKTGNTSFKNRVATLSARVRNKRIYSPTTKEFQFGRPSEFMEWMSAICRKRTIIKSSGNSSFYSTVEMVIL